jgi:TetR/AcrR family transcriptional regulator, transcriptional repressor for nem operon
MPKNKQFNEIEVLDKAKDLFNKKGYNGTSMDELVQATGLSRSSIYDTFGDKYSLYLQSLNHYKKQTQSSIEKALEKITSPRKKIQTFFDNTIQDILNDTNRKGCLMINATTELAGADTKIATMACINMEEMEEKFYRWIKEGQVAGEISKSFAPRSLSRHLYNTVTGLRVTGKTKPDKTLLKDIVKTSLALLDI